jgi:hypothetical protein
MSVWRERQKQGFPAEFRIGGRPYVWLDELEAYEQGCAASKANTAA